jgi:branched-chain amino acid transport system ATP-binding protein
MSALVETTRLDAGYDGVPVVRRLDLRVGPGEIVALLGPNGAGKTTTLLTLSGLLEPISGNAHVLGHRVGSEPAERLARRGVALVPEDRGLFFDLTVAENLRLAARGTPDLGAVGAHFPALLPLMRRRAGLLSGGEQQMVALARAVVRKPRLLLVDEMTHGLAPIVVHQLLPFLVAMAKWEGCGILLVEQHVQLALEIAHRVYVLSHGELVLHARAAELVDDPSVLEWSYLGEAAAPRANGAKR